jgi:ssRNA-specific RNase YbeY (16S rRNA maturation enzyme)
MNVIRTVSCKRVLAGVFRTFNPTNSGWVNNAIEWVGEGLEIIGINPVYEETYCDVDVEEYKAKIPCGLKALLGIRYADVKENISNAFKLDLKKSATHKDNTIILTDEKQMTYSLNPNYIHTPYQTGVVRFYFLQIKKDADHFPEVPDDKLTMVALEWYIIMKMLLRGFQHPVISFEKAEQEWEKFYPQAQNSLKFPTIEDIELFRAARDYIPMNYDFGERFYNTQTNIIN